MKCVYLVTCGDYSDYKVCAVFTKKILAQKYIDSFKESHDKFRIEIYDLNPFCHELNHNYKPFFLRMTKDGVCTEIYIENSSYFDSDSLRFGFDINNNMYFYTFAKDESHAIEIANQKRIELIKKNIWGW